MTTHKKSDTKKRSAKKITFISHHAYVIETLKKSPEGPRLYLKEALKDKDPRIFFSALADVVEAYKDNIEALTNNIKALTKIKKASKKPRRTTPAVAKSISSTSRTSLHAKKR